VNELLTRPLFIFDVESVGLYGEDFAVAWEVVRWDAQARSFTRLETHFLYTEEKWAEGLEPNHAWVRENVSYGGGTYVVSQYVLRELFWASWLSWKAQGAVACAEVPFPVEASFLRRCVENQLEAREWEAPYPLIDIRSITALCRDEISHAQILPEEVPVHNPLCDVRHSTRQLREALIVLGRADHV
jgi:hypothetical protein